MRQRISGFGARWLVAGQWCLPLARPLLQQLLAVIIHVAIERLHGAVANNPELVGDGFNKMRIMANQNDGTLIGVDRMNQRFAAFDIQMIGWLIQNEDVRRVDGGQSHKKSGFLAT